MPMAWICITTRRPKVSARRAGRFVEAVEDAAALARAVTFELQGRGRDDRSGRIGYHASRGDGVAVT